MFYSLPLSPSPSCDADLYLFAGILDVTRHRAGLDYPHFSFRCANRVSSSSYGGEIGCVCLAVKNLDLIRPCHRPLKSKSCVHQSSQVSARSNSSVIDRSEKFQNTGLLVFDLRNVICGGGFQTLPSKKSKSKHVSDDR